MAPRENENKAYAKFGGDKQRTLWYVMVFSGVVNYSPQCQWLVVEIYLAASRPRYLPTTSHLHFGE